MSAISALDGVVPSSRINNYFVVPLITSADQSAAVTTGNEIFRFCFDHNEDLSNHPGQITVDLIPSEGGPIEEAWFTQGEVESGHIGNINYSKCAEYLFTSIAVPLSDDESVCKITHSIYSQLLEATRSLGFPHLVRGWNYLPCINQGTGDNERYRQFGLGRAQAFTASNISSDLFPAGTAIGTSGNSMLQVVLLSGSKQAEMVENFRQTSAYQYPRRYGPVGPSFARASHFKTQHAQQLFVSGTASIVGSDSCHRDDLTQQLDEILANIQTLLDNSEHQPEPSIATPLFRVYLRCDADTHMIRQHIFDQFGTSSRIQILSGDICRAELSIEIECIFWTS
jgi:chorismate lyase/3-hydroxybenzoate synthase